MTIIVVFIVVAVLLALFFLRQSQGRRCPRCGTAMPAIRIPASLHEFTRGGWTCPSCGTKIDRHGHERVSATS